MRQEIKQLETELTMFREDIEAKGFLSFQRSGCGDTGGYPP